MNQEFISRYNFRLAQVGRKLHKTKNTFMKTLFDTLIARTEPHWQRYTQHDFLRQIGDGTLPSEQFEHYLKQDYLFLIHFARAFGLAAFKSRNVLELRQATDSLNGIINMELDLHIQYCQNRGIDQKTLETTVESTPNMAYTRYVMERGLAGDLSDLNVALAPCIVGYAVSANWLQEQPFLITKNNPYSDWIAMYSGDEYQAVAQAHRTTINNIPTPDNTRLEELTKTFEAATRLEIDFWQMGLDMS